MAFASLAIGAALSCTDLPTDPKTPFAISFSHAPSPSVVLGDVLRDSTGAPAPLEAIAFNLRGDTIQDATITYFLVAKDTQPVALAGDQITALADTVYIGDTARVVAVAGGVQSTPLRIVVTVRPDSIRRVGADTVRFPLLALDTVPLSAAMQVKLLHLVTASERARDTVVPVYEVRYHVDSTSSHLSDTSYVTISDGSHHYAPVDTTDVNGIAARQLRVRRAKYPYAYEQIPPGGSAVDTVYVSATARYRGTEVAGGPIRFRVFVTLSKPPTS
jgi:hypothetical protein